MVSRADRSALAEWWWTVDKYILGGSLVLMLVGIVLSFAGSPAVAERLGYDSFHFVTRHIAFAVPALAVLIATSFLSPQSARRVSLVVLGVMLVMMLATLFIGIDVKGARRWINFGELSIQPSEFMKPAFVVTVAWLFAENRRRQDIHGDIFAVILLVIVAALLIAEPDFGQTMLSLISWSLLFFMAGMSWFWIVPLIAVGFGGVFAAYTLLPHVAARIDKFISPASGDTFQVDKALDSILHGGCFVVGPGEGMVKRVLPDAHTDFIFAVGAEEFGIIACLVLVLTFALIVFRGLSRSTQIEDPFARLATAGLVVLFGVQSVINISVNLNLIPAKGMTLPFISYGGSSMIAMGFEIGLLLAFTRRRAEASRLAPRLGFPTSASPGVA